MDPDTTLNNLRLAIDKLEASPGMHPDLQDAYVNDMIDAFDALDAWMQSGGFLPKDWSKNRDD